jgi:uncharacterized protein YqgV (UPF0045/DUF77 family)
VKGTLRVVDREAMATRVEFTVEPFAEGNPGRHVLAAIAAAETGGLRAEIGPFSTIVEGERSAALSAVGALLAAALAEGASRVSLQVSETEPSAA